MNLAEETRWGSRAGNVLGDNGREHFVGGNRSSSSGAGAEGTLVVDGSCSSGSGSGKSSRCESRAGANGSSGEGGGSSSSSSGQGGNTSSNSSNSSNSHNRNNGNGSGSCRDVDESSSSRAKAGRGVSKVSCALLSAGGLALFLNAGILTFHLESVTQQVHEAPQLQAEGKQEQGVRRQHQRLLNEKTHTLATTKHALWCNMLAMLASTCCDVQTEVQQFAVGTAPVLLRLLVHLLQENPGGLNIESLVSALVREVSGRRQFVVGRALHSRRLLNTPKP